MKPSRSVYRANKIIFTSNFFLYNHIFHTIMFAIRFDVGNDKFVSRFAVTDVPYAI